MSTVSDSAPADMLAGAARSLQLLPKAPAMAVLQGRKSLLDLAARSLLAHLQHDRHVYFIVNLQYAGSRATLASKRTAELASVIPGAEPGPACRLLFPLDEVPASVCSCAAC